MGMSFLDPGKHVGRIFRKLELDRGRADEPCVTDGREIFLERRVASTGWKIAMVDPVAIGNVDMRYTSLEAPDVLGRNALEPKVGDVDGRLDVGQADRI